MADAGCERSTRRVGGYEVIERVTAASGQGPVYRAVDADGQVVSLKVLERWALGAHRVEEVHAALVRRRHQALGRQIDVFRTPGDDRLHVVAVWVDGDTLAARAPGAPVADVLRWARQVAEALDHLHADLAPDGPLLHRDIKPSNIVVTPAGDAVLIDPGLARVGPSLATGSPYGTPGFVPPECVADHTAGSPAADRWQLAATVVAALLDEPPGWRDDRTALRGALVARLAGEVPDPGRLADAVLAMLATDPADRPGSAAGWVAELHRASAASPGRHRSRHRTRRRLAVAAGAAIALAAAGGVGAAVARGTARPPGEAAGPAVRSGPGFTRQAVIDTRVTSGPHIDDQGGAYLSTRPLDQCRAFGCEVPRSALATGDTVTLTCMTIGARVTNGNDASPVDDDNAIRFESGRWYGATLPDGTSGLLSEVWVHPDDRGGRGLPQC